MSKTHTDLLWTNKKVAGLELLCTEPLDASKASVILMHGYGANEEDFAPIALHLQNAQHFNWIFPRGPVSVDTGNGMQGYAWFPIRLSEIQEWMKTGRLRQLHLPTLEGFEKAREQIQHLITELQLDYSRCFISGFSQGATIATDLVLRGPQWPLALGVWSGTFVAEAGWEDLQSHTQGLRVLQTHGRFDQVLDFSLAEKLHQGFVRGGAQAELLAFDGAHEFPLSAIAAFDKLLGELWTKLQ